MKFEELAREAGRALSASGRSTVVPPVAEVWARRRRRSLVLGSVSVAVVAAGVVATAASIGGIGADDRITGSVSQPGISVPAATVPREVGGLLFGPPRIDRGDLVEFPITLLDGTNLSLTLPQSLADDIAGFIPGGAASWRQDPCCGRTLDVMYGSVADVYGERQPGVEYEDADGSPVGFYTEEDDVDHLVFQYGSWVVRAWDGDAEGQRFSEENREMFAALMRGAETAEGFLVLDPVDPMTIGPTDSPDATLTDLAEDGVVGVFKGRDCASEDPSANPDMVTSTGHLVSFAESSGMTSICFPENSLHLWVSRLDLAEAELESIDLTFATGARLTTTTSTPTATSEATTSTSTQSTTTTTIPNDSDPVPIGPLAPRGGASVVWTGEEMIVWGGCPDEMCRTRFADGAAYNPATDSWRMIPDTPIPGVWYHLSTWTGSEMLIVGGTQSNRTGAAYSPASDSWRVLPEAPFGVGFERYDGAALRDNVGAVWIGDRFLIWDPRSDQVSAYLPDENTWTPLPPTGLDVDLGVLRWSGTDLVALGALTSVYPDRVPLQAVRFNGERWEPLGSEEMWTENYNVGARPHLSGWAGDVLVAFTDSGGDVGRTMSYDAGTEAWVDIEPIPLPGSEGFPEPISIGDRLLAFYGEGGAIYDSDSESWTNVDIPFGEAGRAVWTGEEVIFWGEICCYGSGGQPFEMLAWRFTPPRS